ncbi:MAG TPA: hypothetical protein PK011_09015, partial [Marinagarivorans sp.]|nr:hypothetical protein [Marinagarivorans sp.]
MAERFMFDTYFPLYHGAPLGNADFRCHWDDFVVDEELPPMDLGAGEHVYLQIRKRGINTEWLARQLGIGYRKSSIGSLLEAGSFVATALLIGALVYLRAPWQFAAAAATAAA